MLSPEPHSEPDVDPAGLPGTGPRAGVWALIDRSLAGLRPAREPLSLLVDAAVVVLAWQLTYLFRLGFERWWSVRPPYDAAVLAGLVALYAAVFVALRVPRTMWRFVGFGDIQRLALACTVAGVLGGLVVAGLLGLKAVPRAVLVLHPFVVLMGVCSARLFYRMLWEHLRSRLQGQTAPTRVALVIGAGEAARRLIAGIQGQGWRVAGLLDDDPLKRGLRVGGVPVLGPTSSVREQALALRATHLIVAVPSVRGAARRLLVERAAAVGLPLLTVPSAQELREGSEASGVRDIRPDDLLGREPVALDEAGIAATIEGKVVLVTGAGGSIGSELCVQLARFRPARLVLLELSEYALYGVTETLAERVPGLAVTPLIGDVKDGAALRRVFHRERPQVVFHAAAYKHVPLMEVDNALAALRNNTVGTWQAAVAAGEAGVERFVLISTDKAVNPINVMGATKRAAEILMATLATGYPATRFMAVRFGNVLGSSGSVIPRFQRQIAAGGPVTVTHPEIIRYFMTVPEACRLVLQAAAIGDSGQVLVMDMGEPVKILDLARTLIRLSGHRIDEIPVTFTGLRPGEKLYEELLADADTTLPTAVPQLRLAQLPDVADGAAVVAWLEGIAQLPPDDDAAVRAHLRGLVAEYRTEPIP